MTPSEELVNRYSRIERESDAFGRVIGVRRLKVSQQVKVSEMTPNLEGVSEVTTENGATIQIPRRSMAVIAAAVCEIDGVMMPFPRSRAELDHVMDRLDDEGLAAAVIAFGRFNPPPAAPAPEGEEEPAEDAVDLAKK